MTSPDPAPPDPRVALAWQEHLLDGGTTPWARWRDASQQVVRAPADGAAARPLVPGAQQLELLRVLNTLGRPGAPLASRVLAASGLGRGLADLPLHGGPRGRFGPRPVDPEDLPLEELLRVAVLLVADDLHRHARTAPGPATGPEQHDPGRRRVLPRPRAPRLVGDPWVVERLHEDLHARRRRPGGRLARVLVVAGPVDRLLADAWAARCLLDPPPPWPRWLDAASGRALPPAVDVAATAAAHARQVGRRRVVVVTDPARLPRLLGERRLPPPARLTADAADLARRVGGALDVVVRPEQRPALLRHHLLPLLLAHQGPGPGLAVPARHHAWVHEAAERQHRAVREAGYAVAGALEDLLPGRGGSCDGPRRGAAAPDRARVLRLAGRLVLAGQDRDDAGGGP